MYCNKRLHFCTEKTKSLPTDAQEIESNNIVQWLLWSNAEVGEKLKKEYLECAGTFAVYHKKLSSTNQSANNSKLLAILIKPSSTILSTMASCCVSIFGILLQLNSK